MSHYKPLVRNRAGQMLCNAHATSCVPRFHTEGCVACAAARAKGIQRPDASEYTKKQRRAMCFGAVVGASREDLAKAAARRKAAKRAMDNHFRENLPGMECR